MKADNLDLLKKNHIPKFFPISIIITTFKVLLIIFVFCFFLKCNNNVIINV